MIKVDKETSVVVGLRVGRGARWGNPMTLC